MLHKAVNFEFVTVRFKCQSSSSRPLKPVSEDFYFVVGDIVSDTVSWLGGREGGNYFAD